AFRAPAVPRPARLGSVVCERGPMAAVAPCEPPAKGAMLKEVYRPGALLTRTASPSWSALTPVDCPAKILPPQGVFFTEDAAVFGDAWEIPGFMYQADHFHLAGRAQNYLPGALEYMVQPSGLGPPRWEAECRQTSASEVGAAGCEAASDCSTIDSCLQGRRPRAARAEGKQLQDLGPPECPTEGSAAHRSGKCKPCAFFFKEETLPAEDNGVLLLHQQASPASSATSATPTRRSDARRNARCGSPSEARRGRPLPRDAMLGEGSGRTSSGEASGLARRPTQGCCENISWSARAVLATLLAQTVLF
ncbi:unnamed protein product, partial [Prorocentrum cordatum]